MVRVFSTYHYRGQNIHTINDDIVSSCLLDNEHIIVAKLNHIIEIVTLPKKSNDINYNGCGMVKEKSISFPTVDQVQQLVYCMNGNYIITIESRICRRQADKLFCRVYTNWNVASSGYNVSIRARIAGKVTPSNNSDCLEVIEIPLKGTPSQVACCQMTGNIAISTGQSILFYKCISCINESTKYQYIDFKEIPFAIDLEFIPTKLLIAEHCICCLNHEFVNILKIVENNSSQSDDMISANSLTSDISNNGVIVCKKSLQCIDFDEKRPNDWAVVISSTSDEQSVPPRKPSVSEYRPINVEMECTLRRLSTKGLDTLPSYNKEYSVKTLLKVKQRDARDPFKHVYLKPIYMNRTENTDCETTLMPDHVLKSINCESFVGIAVLIGTANDGYLYQFSNNEKWMSDDGNFIAMYPFTSPAIDIAINDFVVHILTDRGIETYTHRIGHKIFSNSYEYNLRDDFPIETCPRIDEPICLIGLRPFLGLRTMHCTNFSLMLLANSTVAAGIESKRNSKIDMEASWTIYNLVLPTPEILFTDFEELANSYSGEGPSTYMHLMSEAHMIMRVAMEFYQIRRQDSQAALTKYDSPDCEMIYLNSCRKLGDFCVVSGCREEYCLAFPYYTMGKISIDELYDRVLTLNGSLIGLVHTLKNMLIKCRYSSESIGRLLTSIRPNKSISFGEELIELFLTEVPNEIAVLTLRSTLFRDYMSGKACEAIKSKQHITDEDKLCLILEYVRNNNAKEANFILNNLTENQLFGVLIEYWNLLFDTTFVKKTGKRVVTFSELTEVYLLASSSDVIQTCITNIFVYLMVDAKVVSIDLLLKLLMDYLASHVGQTAYITAQFVLQVLLELYYYHLYVVRQYTGATSDQSVVLESMTTTTSSSDVKVSQSNPNQSNYSVSVPTDSCAIEHYYCESIQNEAMKILIRIYLGKLKKARVDLIKLSSVDNTELFRFMRQNLSLLFEHHQNYNDNLFAIISNGPESLPLPLNQRPILFLEKRSNYLNTMNPLTGIPNDMEMNLNNLKMNLNDVQLTVIKFQALLCSSKLSRDILQEIIYFFEANSPIIGMDCFISILLPASNCIDFFIDQYPQYLLPYAKSRIIFDKDWLDFLTRILDQKQKIIKKYSCTCYENLLTDILKHIVTTKRLVQVFKILPIKDTTDTSSDPLSTESDDSTSDIDEEILFTQYLSVAIDRDRAERLGEMIKTTGYQLYDTYNKNKQCFN